MDQLGILVPLAPFLMVAFIVWTKHQSKMAELRVKETAEKAEAHFLARVEARAAALAAQGKVDEGVKDPEA